MMGSLIAANHTVRGALTYLLFTSWRPRWGALSVRDHTAALHGSD